MSLSALDILALIAIGIGVGLAFSLVAVMVYSLYRTVSAFRASSSSVLARVHDALAADKFAMDQIRSEVNLALSRIDAERLYSASLQIQRSAKLFSQQIDQLQRVVFAQPSAPALDFTSGGLAEEAESDAGMIAEQGRRWQGGAAQPSPSQTDPLAGLSEEERRQRTLEYFERRRATAAGFPYAPSSPNPHNPLNPLSTPPAAGSGVYASLLDEASQRPVTSPAPVDFSGLELEEGAELVNKGELG